MSALTVIGNNALTSATDKADLVSALKNSLYPGASDSSIEMVLAYCQAGGYDPMTKPVHIVPMWDKNAKSMRDTIMPGIGLYRIIADRSGKYAGQDDVVYGPILEGWGIKFPEWCKVTVYKITPVGRVPYPATVRWLESYATANKDVDTPNAMWKKRPFGQLEKCFCPETEVLTSNGFERFSAVTGRIMQVNERGLEPTEAQPFAQDYDGEMIVVDSARLNFSVTPNHDMITSAGRMEAGTLFDNATTDQTKIYIPRAPVNAREDFSGTTDAALKLAGYILADGTIRYRTAIISVSRQYKIEALEDLGLHRLLRFKEAAGHVAQANGRDIVSTTDKTEFVYDFNLVDWLIDNEKTIDPDALMRLSQRQARLLVDALIEFDGSDNGNGTRRLHQTHAAVLAGFELAAVHAGYSISARHPRTSDIGQPCSSITVSDAPHFPVYKTDGAAGLVKRRNVAGKVWCVTVPSGIIVVRRNGFSMVCGNCAEAAALRKAFPEIGAQPTADEMQGKMFEMEELQPANPPATVADSKSKSRSEELKAKINESLIKAGAMPAIIPGAPLEVDSDTGELIQPGALVALIASIQTAPHKTALKSLKSEVIKLDEPWQSQAKAAYNARLAELSEPTSEAG